MYPNQQPQYPPPTTGNQYDFIMTPSSPKRRFSLPLGGNNLAVKLAVIAGGALILVILLAIILSLFTSGNTDTKDLTALAQTEDELVHVAAESANNTTESSTQNLAATVQLVMGTQQQQVVQTLAKQKVKLSTKQLQLKQNTTTDQQLTSAETASDYDSVFAQIMQQQLQNYENTLKQMYGATKSTTERNLTAAYYHQTQLILTEVPSS